MKGNTIFLLPTVRMGLSMHFEVSQEIYHHRPFDGISETIELLCSIGLDTPGHQVTLALTLKKMVSYCAQ